MIRPVPFVHAHVWYIFRHGKIRVIWIIIIIKIILTWHNNHMDFIKKYAILFYLNLAKHSKDETDCLQNSFSTSFLVCQDFINFYRQTENWEAIFSLPPIANCFKNLTLICKSKAKNIQFMHTLNIRSHFINTGQLESQRNINLILLLCLLKNPLFQKI